MLVDGPIGNDGNLHISTVMTHTRPFDQKSYGTSYRSLCSMQDCKTCHLPGCQNFRNRSDTSSLSTFQTMVLPGHAESLTRKTLEIPCHLASGRSVEISAICSPDMPLGVTSDDFFLVFLLPLLCAGGGGGSKQNAMARQWSAEESSTST